MQTRPALSGSDDANKAFRNLQFGDTPEIVERKLKNDTGIEFLEDKKWSKVKIGSYSYFLIPAFNDKNELHTVMFISPETTTIELKKWWENLIEVIYAKYGHPEISRIDWKSDNYADFMCAYIVLFARSPGLVETQIWTFKTKKIQIGIAEGNKSVKHHYAYLAIMSIPLSEPELQKMKEKEEEERLRKEKVKQQEQLEKQESSQDF